MKLVLVRHGATEWSATFKHTGRTDLALSPEGRDHAIMSKERVHGNIGQARRVRIWSSPLVRARETAAIVMGPDAEVTLDDRLREFDYGDYEGLTTAEIRETVPGWTVFDGCPGGESLADVEHRVDSFIAEVRADLRHSTTVVFAHGHLLRILAARSIGQHGAFAVHLSLDTGAVSVIADLRDGPAITLWNDIRY
ncbi:MAG: histidine phosphatase family protein [Ilumatobacteraceae bacterium]